VNCIRVRVCQEFVHTNLAELLNCHMLQDTAGVTGQVVIELGRAETFLLKCATKQKGGS